MAEKSSRNDFFGVEMESDDALHALVGDLINKRFIIVSIAERDFHDFGEAFLSGFC